MIPSYHSIFYIQFFQFNYYLNFHLFLCLLPKIFFFPKQFSKQLRVTTFPFQVSNIFATWKQDLCDYYLCSWPHKSIGVSMISFTVFFQFAFKVFN